MMHIRRLSPESPRHDRRLHIGSIEGVGRCRVLLLGRWLIVLYKVKAADGAAS